MTALEKLQRTGLRRVRAGKGFTFRTARGAPAPASELPRIRKLAIPPAWTDVHVAPSASAKLQAVGRDKAGRWQYRYHPRFRERQDQRKFEKLVDFADALPRMRKRVAPRHPQPWARPRQGDGLRHPRALHVLHAAGQ